MPAVAMSRRDAAGPASARGLLFTVLGEYVLPAGGTAWTGTLIRVMRRVGVEEKATRQALMRMAADGWLTADRIGRRTRWRLTASAELLLTQGADRIYRFGARHPDWDGSWLMILARTPEAERPARHVLRTRLSRAGFGSPVPGLWISTHAERLAAAQQVLAEAGLSDAQIFHGRHASGELAILVEQAWDIPALARRYDDFSTAFGSATAPDPLARLIELVHAWRRFPWTDPELPRELLPEPWSGAAAARTFHRLHAQWTPAALREWQVAQHENDTVAG